jgi:hypothetical protein
MSGGCHASVPWNVCRDDPDGFRHAEPLWSRRGSIQERQKQTNYDPAKVSDSLKALYHFGSASTTKALNANTVTLLTGTIGGTYVQFGADLASVLDDDGNLRILPIIGRGSVQGAADILFLKGVDLGIVRADTLDYFEKKGIANGIKKQFTYVTRLYNEEMQVIAPKTIKNLNDLEGKTVSVDLPNGGTFVTALTVFERLGIKANFVYIEQRIAMEKLKKGDPRRRHRGWRCLSPPSTMTAAFISLRWTIRSPCRAIICRRERLSAGDADFEGLSEPDSRRGDGGHDRSAVGACSVQLGTQH